VDTLGAPRTKRAAEVACGGGKMQRDCLTVECHLLETKTSQMIGPHGAGLDSLRCSE